MILKQFISGKGKSVTIRKVNEEEATEIIEFVKYTLSAFSEFVLTTAEEFNPSIEEEKEWIRSHNAAGNFLAIAVLENKIAGIIHLKPGHRKKVAHTGELAIALRPDFTDQKIGTELMLCLIDWAKKNPNLEKLILNVSEKNTRAIHLYKKLGFTEEGLNIKAVKQADGSYTNNAQMALFV